MTDRTDIEILEQTNEIAARFYQRMGYRYHPELFFWDDSRRNYHPQERLCWELACTAQEIISFTDLIDTLQALQSEPEGLKEIKALKTKIRKNMRKKGRDEDE